MRGFVFRVRESRARAGCLRVPLSLWLGASAFREETELRRGIMEEEFTNLLTKKSFRGVGDNTRCLREVRFLPIFSPGLLWY